MPYRFPETDTPVRVATIDGEPWFVVADVCKVLGIGNPSDAARRLNEGDLDTIEVTDSLGRRQNAYAANESGLYDLILDSRKPEARAFRRWITAEVIPSIRRTGSYSVAPAAPALPDITTPQGVLALAQQFARTAEQLVEADARLRELEPKALAHDTLMAAQDGDVLVREAAKVLGWQEKQLRAFLLDEHLIYRRQATCGQTQYDFYAANAVHFNAVVRVVSHTWGECAHYTLHITPRGMELIQKRIARRQVEMRDAIGGAR
ncbi:BRO family protein [Kitasatospora sp. CM 4170]|uniref:BRO family protein n=1 Tax=Kitasatospora aburaviensis TaxID=67265 RepID=A0ABW1F3L6_9ACTN|nr:BRO family protein [Kitasatospora sp. CM 4170]WNM50034.1 BRO family protein [Kitasatospora sp. CM 4170]